MAFNPPASVYTITPSGIRKLAAKMFTPVSALTTAEPPRSNMAVTRMFVMKQKTRKTICAGVPQLIDTTQKHSQIRGVPKGAEQN